MISYNEAIKIIRREVTPTEAIEIPLIEACDTVLAHGIRSPEPIPPFDASMMDGFALRSRDGLKASGDRPIPLRIIGEAAAGRPLNISIKSGEAARTMTGAPIPTGADAVVMEEECTVSGHIILLRRPPLKGENIRRKGSELKRGARILSGGSRLDPFALSLLGRVGITSVRVHRRPVIAVMTTGSELVDIHSYPPPGGIRNSNTVMMALLIRKAGGVPKILGIARDTKRSIIGKIRRASGSDMLIITGGSAGGKYDLVKDALAEMEGELAFHGVEMHPGRTTSFGRMGGLLFFSLPGNPYASFIGFLALVQEAIFGMSGFKGETSFTAKARLGGDVPPGKGGMRFILAALERDGDQLIASPKPHLSTMAARNRGYGLIEVDSTIPPPRKGEEVRVRIMI